MVSNERMNRVEYAICAEISEKSKSLSGAKEVTPRIKSFCDLGDDDKMSPNEQSAVGVCDARNLRRTSTNVVVRQNVFGE
mmetsp:Transcript_3750/g.7797  ORF Transcript_3750/g.7797 Transcript_3750/m.7797 type:complete len:80 (+) Transcript_3750:1868-2107(+)